MQDMKGRKIAHNSLVKQETSCSDSAASLSALLYVCNPACLQSWSTAAVPGVSFPQALNTRLIPGFDILSFSPSTVPCIPALLPYTCIPVPGADHPQHPVWRHRDNSAYQGCKRGLKNNLLWQITEPIKSSDTMHVQFYRNLWQRNRRAVLSCYLSSEENSYWLRRALYQSKSSKDTVFCGLRRFHSCVTYAFKR